MPASLRACLAANFALHALPTVHNVLLTHQSAYLMNQELSMTSLLEAGIIPTVVQSYLTYKQWQCDAASRDSTRGNVAEQEVNQCIDCFVLTLLDRAVQEQSKNPGQGSKGLEAIEETPVTWAECAADSIVNAFGVWAETMQPTLPTSKAMEFLSTCVCSPGMHTFCLTRSQPYFDALHIALMKSAGQDQNLLVIAVVGQLCLLETILVDDVFRPHYSCAKALKKKAFSSFLPAYRAAVMKDLTLWEENHATLISNALYTCANLPQQLLDALAQDVPEILNLSVRMITQLPKLKRRLDMRELSLLVTNTACLLRALPGDPFSVFQQDSYKALAELMVHYTHPAPAVKPSKDLLGLQSTLVDCLILPDADFKDSGDEVFDLTAVWWNHCCQQAKQDELDDEDLLPRLFWAMLGRRIQQQASTAPSQSLVQAVCSALTHLFLLVKKLADCHKRLRDAKTQPYISPSEAHSPGVEVVADEIAVVIRQEKPVPADTLEADRSKAKILELVSFFRVVAGHGGVLEGLKQEGPSCWCLDDNSPHKMAQDLAYLTIYRALPIADVRTIQAAFALTKTPDKSQEEAASKQAAAAEQQAAAKAAAKKAKKLHQKLNRQQQQQPEPSSPLHGTADTTPPDSPSTPLQHDRQTVHAPAEPTHCGPGNVGAASAAIATPMSAVLPGTCFRDHSIQASPMQQTGTPTTDTESDEQFLQSLFTCPLYKAVMRDCVIAEDGYSYERAAIVRWLHHRHSSPVTGKPLAHKRLLPNVWLKQAMDMHPPGPAIP